MSEQKGSGTNLKRHVSFCKIVLKPQKINTHETVPTETINVHPESQDIGEKVSHQQQINYQDSRDDHQSNSLARGNVENLNTNDDKYNIYQEKITANKSKINTEMTQSIQISRSRNSKSHDKLGVPEECGNRSPIINVRHMTDNFEELFNKGTVRIEKLSKVCSDLESEQERLENVNIDFTTEKENLMHELGEWEKNRKGLMIANEKYVDEVTRLYREQDLLEEEKNSLLIKRQEMEEEFRRDLIELEKNQNNQREKYGQQRKQFRVNVEILQSDKVKLKQQSVWQRKESTTAIEELNRDYQQKNKYFEKEIQKLETKIKRVTYERGEGENKLDIASIELEKLDAQHENIKTELKEKDLIMKSLHGTKITQFENRISKLTSDNSNFDILNATYSIELENLKKIEEELKEKVGGLKKENHKLIEAKKEAIANEEKMEEMGRELSNLKNLLKQEQNKVGEISNWKQHLSTKHDTLKEENTRLTTKTDHLEKMMSAEETDIQDILGMIYRLEDGKTDGKDDIGSYRKQ